MAAERVRCVAAKKATIILYPAQMAQLADLLNEFSEALHRGLREGAGRPRSRKKRCPCGAMTVRRATVRYHVCEAKKVRLRRSLNDSR